MSLRPHLLGLVALALAVAVAWTYWPAPPVQPSASPTAPTKPAPVAMLNPLSQRAVADFAALFDHPLFDPARNKPVVQALPINATPAVAGADQTAVAPVGPPHPVLMGTVTSPWPGGAYLGDDQGGPVVFLRPGQAALGLHLEEARPDSAIFMGPVGEVTLTLHKADAPFVAAPDATAAMAMPAAP